MAIKVRIAKPGLLVYHDNTTGLHLPWTDGRARRYESPDLTGKNCINIKRAIADGILELTEGRLGYSILEGTVSAGDATNIDLQAAVSFHAIRTDIQNVGSTVFYVSFNNATPGLSVQPTTTLSITHTIPTQYVTIMADSGGDAKYKIGVD